MVEVCTSRNAGFDPMAITVDPDNLRVDGSGWPNHGCRWWRRSVYPSGSDAVSVGAAGLEVATAPTLLGQVAEAPRVVVAVSQLARGVYG